MRKENITELSPAAMQRRARQFDEDAADLARRAEDLRRHANKLRAERKREQKRIGKTRRIIVK